MGSTRSRGAAKAGDRLKARGARRGVKGRAAAPQAVADPLPVEQRYDVAMRAINEGVYDWDVANGTIFFSEGVYSVLNMPQGMKTPADWRNQIHPDDLAKYDAAIVAHFKGRTDRFECDYRFRSRDGTWRWARQHGIAMRDQRGRAVRMIGSTGDITQFKHTEEALKAPRSRSR